MRFELSPTSALVLLWAEETSYKSKSAKAFFQAVSLEKGKPLLKKFNSIWKSYGEVIKNRKFAVWTLSRKLLEKKPDFQVVCLGAGLDPLSLDIAEQFTESNIFDVDLDNMNLKSEIVKKINGPENIKFVASDVSNSVQLIESLKVKGWDNSKPTLTIVEGLSYFLSEKDLENAIKILSIDGAAVIEHLVPLEQVSNERRGIPKMVFGSIMEDFNLPSITKYGELEIQTLSKKIGLRWNQTLKMADIEAMRTEKNTFFPTPDSGWICVSSMEAID